MSRTDRFLLTVRPCRIGALLGASQKPEVMAWLFFLQAILAVLLLATLVPPFENSDEFTHFQRVDQIASGRLLATRYGGPQTSGGRVDLGIGRVDDIIARVRFHPELKVTGSMLRDAYAIPWGQHGQVTFANTSIYAPVLYVPAVAGVWIGKLAHLSIARTEVLSRAFMGVLCAGIAAFAIAAAGEAAPFLLVVLSLPMSLSLFASVSQDGPMLVAAAATVALVSRFRGTPDRRQAASQVGWVMCLAVALLALGRPPYGTMAVLALVLPGPQWRTRGAWLASMLAPAAMWSALVSAMTMINAVAFRGVNPSAQLSSLLVHPERLWTLAVHAVTDKQGMEGLSFYKEFVGVLGWIDVVLPQWFYGLAGVAVLFAIGTLLLRREALLPPLAQGACFLAALAATLGIFLLEYLTWTEVDAPFIDGVQGRYFLPVALMLPLFTPNFGQRALSGLQRSLSLTMLAFPTVSVLVTVSSVVRRYYI